MYVQCMYICMYVVPTNLTLKHTFKQNHTPSVVHVHGAIEGGGFGPPLGFCPNERSKLVCILVGAKVRRFLLVTASYSKSH